MVYFYQKKALHLSAFFVLQGLLLWPIAATAGAAPTCPTSHIDERAVTGYVIDGDTLRLEDGRKVRLIGINAPELGGNRAPEPLGPEAARALQDLIGPGTPVLLRYGPDRRDRHQRLLAHVFLEDGTNIQQRLLAEGLAAAIAVPPNLWALDCYRQNDLEARRANAGIWSASRFQPAPASELNDTVRGFYIIRGRVTDVGRQREATHIELDGRLSLRIDDKDLRYFKDLPLLGLRNHRIEVRGWVHPYGKWLQMRVQHPAYLDVLD